MKKTIDRAVILRRVNYAERDRIVTALCENAGKITLFVKGARAQKSKLSGGVELLNINELIYIESKKDLKNLISSRMLKSNEKIVTSFDRTNLIFENLKLINKVIEDNHGQELFELLDVYLDYMNKLDYDFRIVEIWFKLKLLNSLGLMSDLVVSGDSIANNYKFTWDNQEFISDNNGDFTKNDIKLLRLLKSAPKPMKLSHPTETEDRLLNFIGLLSQANLN